MPKFHAGLDVADATTSLCVLTDKGDVICETAVATDPKAIAAALAPYKRMLAHVGQESGTKSNWLHKELAKRGYPVVCLDAFHAKKALSARRNKSDRTDAKGLATLLARGLFTTAHVRSAESQRLRLLLNVRSALQRKALDLQCAMRMSMKGLGAQPKAKRRRMTAANTEKLDATPKRLYAALLRASAVLIAEAKALDAVVLSTARADPVCRRLMTVPGVGPITALIYRAAVDDPSRFRSSRDVAGYFGLTPKRTQSGQSDFSGNVTRQGDRAVRAALYSAACALLNNTRSQSALLDWAKQLAQRKRFKIAAVACARKLAVIMHSMWLNGEDFDPRRL